MPYDPRIHTGRLRRLDPEFYRGAAWVHWSMTLEGRKTGWLTEKMHSVIRETLLHTAARYSLICPVYCLMPDHCHFLLGGLTAESDQRLAVRFFRKEWNRQLALLDQSFKLQKQAYDHVLKNNEVERNAFQDVSWYLLQNPERGNLVEDFRKWPFMGSLVCGYPDLDPCQEDTGAFWELFWKLYERLRDWDST